MRHLTILVLQCPGSWFLVRVGRAWSRGLPEFPALHRNVVDQLFTVAASARGAGVGGCGAAVPRPLDATQTNTAGDLTAKRHRLVDVQPDLLTGPVIGFAAEALHENLRVDLVQDQRLFRFRRISASTSFRAPCLQAPRCILRAPEWSRWADLLNVGLFQKPGWEKLICAFMCLLLWVELIVLKHVLWKKV